MNVLVIDIGGSHIKLCLTDSIVPLKFDSGPDLTPVELVKRVQQLTHDSKYDVISLGFPGRVDANGVAAEPGNLGNGWVGFDFQKAFGKPVRVVNDAAMQALGGYEGGRMLFLGLGTGLGSALIAERVVIPLELGHLAHRSGQTLGERLGRDGLAKHGREIWQQDVMQTVKTLRDGFDANYVLIGGGNAALVDPLPPNTRRGGNEDACAGGFRLWEEFVEPHDRRPANVWRVL